MIRKFFAAAAAATVALSAANAATTYTVESFERTNSGGTVIETHSMWLHTIEQLFGGTNRRFDFNPNGTLLVRDNGTAQLTGRVEEIGSVSDGFNVTVEFGLLTAAEDLVKQPKLSNGLGGIVDGSAFDYFSLERGKLEGFGTFADFDLKLTERLGDNNHFGQLGFGANDKTATDGFSAWFFWKAANSCSVSQCANVGERKGDFNLDVAVLPNIGTEVPIPGAAVLMGGVLAGFGALRRRKAS